MKQHQLNPRGTYSLVHAHMGQSVLYDYNQQIYNQDAEVLPVVLNVDQVHLKAKSVVLARQPVSAMPLLYLSDPKLIPEGFGRERVKALRELEMGQVYKDIGQNYLTRNRHLLQGLSYATMMTGNLLQGALGSVEQKPPAGLPIYVNDKQERDIYLSCPLDASPLFNGNSPSQNIRNFLQIWYMRHDLLQRCQSDFVFTAVDALNDYFTEGQALLTGETFSLEETILKKAEVDLEFVKILMHKAWDFFTDNPDCTPQNFWNADSLKLKLKSLKIEPEKDWYEKVRQEMELEKLRLIQDPDQNLKQLMANQNQLINQLGQFMQNRQVQQVPNQAQQVQQPPALDELADPWVGNLDQTGARDAGNMSNVLNQPRNFGSPMQPELTKLTPAKDLLEELKYQDPWCSIGLKGFSLARVMGTKRPYTESGVSDIYLNKGTVEQLFEILKTKYVPDPEKKLVATEALDFIRSRQRLCISYDVPAYNVESKALVDEGFTKTAAIYKHVFSALVILCGDTFDSKQFLQHIMPAKRTKYQLPEGLYYFKIPATDVEFERSFCPFEVLITHLPILTLIPQLHGQLVDGKKDVKTSTKFNRLVELAYMFYINKNVYNPTLDLKSKTMVTHSQHLVKESNLIRSQQRLKRLNERAKELIEQTQMTLQLDKGDLSANTLLQRMSDNYSEAQKKVTKLVRQVFELSISPYVFIGGQSGFSLIEKSIKKGIFPTLADFYNLIEMGASDRTTPAQCVEFVNKLCKIQSEVTHYDLGFQHKLLGTNPKAEERKQQAADKQEKKQSIKQILHQQLPENMAVNKRKAAVKAAHDIFLSKVKEIGREKALDLAKKSLFQKKEVKQQYQQQTQQSLQQKGPGASGPKNANQNYSQLLATFGNAEPKKQMF